jgi:cell division protein FtsQ
VSDRKRQLRTLRKQAKLQKKLAKKEAGSYLANRLLGGFLTASFIGLIGLVIATFQTPLLAIEKVSFEGNQLLSEQQLSEATLELMGQPLTTVSESKVESLLSNFTLVESFAIQSRPPHELVIRVRERQPIASVITAEGEFIYDAAGVELSPYEGQQIPRVVIVENPAESSRYRSAVEVLLSLPLGLYREVSLVSLNTQDSVELTLRSGTRVIWGDDSQAKLKHEVLQTLIANQTEDVDFDVSAPLAPVVVYRDF